MQTTFFDYSSLSDNDDTCEVIRQFENQWIRLLNDTVMDMDKNAIK